MAYDWTQIRIKEITNLYLYGRLDKPGDLTSEALIRPLPVKDANGDIIATTIIEINMTSFMTTGPGRFANGALSSIVTTFMTGIHPAFLNTGVRQVFTKQDMIDRIGGQYNLAIQQYNYADATDDYALRSYIYGSSGFEIADNAIFIIEADGTRHIENYAIHALDDNFDFDSNNRLTQAGNLYLEARIDPSGIGRTVGISITGKELVPTIDYTLSDYRRDIQRYNDTFTPSLAITRLLPEMISVVGNLWSDGVTQFLDGDKPILYGTTGADYLAAYQADHMPTLKDYAANGVVLMGGPGADYLIGGKGNDILRGGAGNDTYYYDGEGHDKIIDEDNTGSKIIYKGATYDLFGGGLFIRKDPSTNLWQTPDGKLTLSHNSPWMLQDGQGGHRAGNDHRASL